MSLLQLETFINSLNIKNIDIVNPNIKYIFNTLNEPSIDGVKFKITINRNSTNDMITFCKFSNENLHHSLLNLIDIIEFNLENDELLAPLYISSKDLVKLQLPNNEPILFSKSGLLLTELSVKFKNNLIDNQNEYFEPGENLNFSCYVIVLKYEFKKNYIQICLLINIILFLNQEFIIICK